MPLEQRVISPIDVARGCFNTGAVGHVPNIPDELECVTNGTLSNIIRQLSSMSKYAEDLFGCLLSEIGTLVQRSSNLQERINVLTDHVERLDASNDPVERGNFQPIIPLVTRTDHFDQQVVARTTIPLSLRDVYDRCDPPPPLEKLNPFRDDNINGLKLYTNPNYFFELWRKEMLTDRTNKNKNAKNRQGLFSQSYFDSYGFLNTKFLFFFSGDNAHNASNKNKRKQNRLHHQNSNRSDNSHQSPQMVSGPNQVSQTNDYYSNNGMVLVNSQKSAPTGTVHSHYHAGMNMAQQASIYNYQTGQQSEIVAMKREEPNPSGIGTYTVIEGSYIDPNNYQHHYVQHQYNGNDSHHHPPPPPPPPLNSLEYQKQQSRPSSLELSHSNPQEYEQQSQQHYSTQNSTYFTQQQQQQYNNNNNYGATNQRSNYGSTSFINNGSIQNVSSQLAQQYPSPSSTLTPTRRAAQLSRPSAPPPAPPGGTGSTPNSNPSTPLHKKIPNGPDNDGSMRMISRDSLPPPPPLPTSVNNHNLSNGTDIMDTSDSSLPPPPPPLPSSNSYNGNQNGTFEFF